METRKLIKSLNEAGHRESALRLKNWGEIDTIAETLSKVSDQKLGHNLMGRSAESDDPQHSPQIKAVVADHMKAWNEHPHHKEIYKDYQNRSVSQDEYHVDSHDNSLGHYVRTGNIKPMSIKVWKSLK